jgi:STE24 endopeptidase
VIAGVFWSALGITLIAQIFLEVQNRRHSTKTLDQLDLRLKEHYGAEKLQKAMTYSGAKSRFVLFSLTFRFLYTLAFLSTPWGVSLAGWWQSLFLPLGQWADLFFVLSLILVLQIIGLPLSLLYNHLVEKPFGFYKQTLGGFLGDQIKGLILSLLLTGGLFWGLEFVLNNLGPLWWLYAWLGFVVFQVFFIVIYPLVIAPLFNKFIPLEEGALKDRLRALAGQLDFPMKDIFVMDGSRRSGHSNAYFTGFGRFRRIVLYDTLIQQHSVEELAAVLAHEIGHYKKRHILWNMLIGFFLTGAGFFTLHLLVGWTDFYTTFGLQPSLAALLVLLFFAMRPLNFLFTPIAAWRSRRAEYEADAYARGAMGGPEAMVEALFKLSRDNLSNPNPSPLYSRFYYSHPPLRDRIRALESSKIN